MEDLIQLVHARGYDAFVLTSQPEEKHISRTATLTELVEQIHIAPGASLNWNDIEQALELFALHGSSIAACISVWDGYRTLMSRANLRLGAPDVAPTVINSLNDKLNLRRVLKQVGVSTVHAEVLSPERLLTAQSEQQRRFIKPRRGLASFGAFELNSSLTWSEIESLRQSMIQDREYSEVMNELPDFIIEDYVAGIECSFEVIAAYGQLHIMGIHEKCELESLGKTVLEAACVSPPIAISPDQLAAGIVYVQQALAAFGADSGCYHVEARFDTQRNSWNLIEVNPRVGGAFINRSVKLLTGGVCLLEAWLDTLIVPSGKGQLQGSLARLARQAVARPYAATFFRVYFGEGGRHLIRLRVNPNASDPWDTVRMIAIEGEELSHSEREVFLGQIIWALPSSLSTDQYLRLLNDSKDALEIAYA